MALAVSSDALNLTELYNLRDIPQPEKETAMSMIQNNSILQDIPQVVDKRLSARGREFVTVSAPNWRQLNEGAGNFKQTPREWSEDTYGFADYLDIDNEILEAEEAEGRAPEGLFDEQIDNYLMGLSFDLNYKFFRNRHIGAPGDDKNPQAFVGLIPRFRDKKKYRIASECEIPAAGLDLSMSGTNGANGSLLIRYIQRACQSLGAPNGEGCVAFVSEGLEAAIEDAIRRMGAGVGFKMTQDAFDRDVPAWRNMKIRTAGRKAPKYDGTADDYVQDQVLSETELQDGSADTGGNCTSLVIVKTGMKNFYMTKSRDLRPGKPYDLENGTHKRVVMRNRYGLVVRNTRSIARVKGIRIS